MKRIGWGAAAIAALMWSGAEAHSPYLLPNAFDATGRDHVTILGSFTEHPFTPDVVMKSDDFHAVGPDGANAPLTPAYFRDLTVLELPTTVNGTWRITSGTRTGRISKVIQSKGEWVFLEPGKPPPAGAAPAEMQSITTSDVYVSRGAPNAAALAAVGKGLEFHALTHPNSISVGQDANFEVLIDGKPLAGQKIQVYSAGADTDGAPPIQLQSDDRGRFSIKVDKPGAFLAMTRYRIAPADGKPGRSLTYTLTFEAVQ